MKTYRPRPGVLVALLAAAILFRILPYILLQLGMSIDPSRTVYPWNFSPFYALCLFGGAFFKDKRWAVALPLLTFFVGDMLIALLTGSMAMGFYKGQPIIYASVALFACFGFMLRNQRPAWLIGFSGFAAAVMFFVVTNFASWFTYAGVTYPNSFAGLMECYAMGIPFFRTTLISLAIYLPVFFSPLAIRQLERSEEIDSELAAAQQTI